jgi:ADP-ribosylglycohydrolase
MKLLNRIKGNLMGNWLSKLFGMPVEESPVEKVIERLPQEGEVNKVYEARWVWYHTILAVEIAFTNVLLLLILAVLAFK